MEDAMAQVAVVLPFPARAGVAGPEASEAFAAALREYLDRCGWSEPAEAQAAAALLDHLCTSPGPRDAALMALGRDVADAMFARFTL